MLIINNTVALYPYTFTKFIPDPFNTQRFESLVFKKHKAELSGIRTSNFTHLFRLIYIHTSINHG